VSVEGWRSGGCRGWRPGGAKGWVGAVRGAAAERAQRASGRATGRTQRAVVERRRGVGWAVRGVAAGEEGAADGGGKEWWTGGAEGRPHAQELSLLTSVGPRPANRN
jgi:hypothetical protein